MNLTLTGIALVAMVAGAQSQTGVVSSRPEFEVASIRPSTNGGPRGGIGASPGGRLSAENVTLKFLVRFAYSVQEFQILEGPSRIASSLYSIAAKADRDVTLEQMRPLLQRLLEERFKLVVHRETRQLPIYELVPAKVGLKITSSKEGSCIVFDRNRSPQGANDPRPNYCGRISISGGSIEAYAVSMQRLVGTLSGAVGRVVVDKTGFTGTFDVHLKFAPDEIGGDSQPGASPGDQSRATSVTGATGPSIFTALQEQLGLKLENTRGPVDVLVIDSAEKPTDN